MLSKNSASANAGTAGCSLPYPGQRRDVLPPSVKLRRDRSARPEPGTLPAPRFRPRWNLALPDFAIQGH